MTKPTLYYWNIRGRAEVARLLMSAAGVDFDVQAPTDMKTDKAHYPFGQCPRFVDDTVDMCQSNAILRYLARKHHMEGTTERDKVVVDQALEAVESLRNKYTHLVYQEQVSDQGKESFLAIHLSKDNLNGRNGGAHVAYLEWFVQQGQDGFITRSGLTVGDLAIWEMTDLLLRIFPDQLAKEYPALKDFHARIAAMPKVAAYLSSPARPAQPNGNSLG